LFSLSAVLLPRDIFPEFIPALRVESCVSEQRRWHVLVVDDEPSILLTAKMIARREGWEITTTQNPREALEMAKRICPTVILSDYVMPELTGPELIAALRRSPETEAIPVVLMSGNSQTLGPGDGASGFLEKPFSLSALRTTLTHAVEGRAATPAI
jgi:CheY-like chemotaxis protein